MTIRGKKKEEDGQASSLVPTAPDSLVFVCRGINMMMMMRNNSQVITKPGVAGLFYKQLCHSLIN